MTVRAFCELPKEQREAILKSADPMMAAVLRDRTAGDSWVSITLSYFPTSAPNSVLQMARRFLLPF